MKLNLMTLAMVGVAGVAAWFLLGKPTSFAQIQAGIGGLLNKAEGAVGIGSQANFAGGWVGAVGNPHFNAHGFDRPGIPGYGYGRSNFYHGGGIDPGIWARGHGYGYPGPIIPGIGGLPFGQPYWPGMYPHHHGFHRGFHRRF